MKVEKLLAVMVVLQGMTLATLYFGGRPTAAMAQIPDAGAQNERIIDELKSLNSKLDKTLTILDGGKLQVRVVKSDESGEPAQ